MVQGVGCCRAPQEEVRLTVLKKQVVNVQSLCKAYHRQTNLLQAFEDCEHFNRTEPVVSSLPCPPWMFQERAKLRAIHAPAVGDFWKYVSSPMLLASGFDAAGLEDVQVGLLADRLMEVVRVDSTKVKGLLVQLLTTDARALVPEVDLGTKVAQATDHVHRIVSFDGTVVNDVGILKASMDFLAGDGVVLAKSLRSFPAGRALLETYEKEMKTIGKQLEQSRGFITYVEGIDMAVPERDFVGTAGEWGAVASAVTVCDSKFCAEELVNKPVACQKVLSSSPRYPQPRSPDSCGSRSVFLFFEKGNRGWPGDQLCDKLYSASAQLLSTR